MKNARKCQQRSPSLNQTRRIILFLCWKDYGYGLVWRGKMVRWFGLTTHQQSYLRGPSTTHGIVASQIITEEMRIVLFWTFIKKSGMTSNAVLVAVGLPMSFVKGQDTLKMICHQKWTGKRSLAINAFNTSFTMKLASVLFKALHTHTHK